MSGQSPHEPSTLLALRGRDVADLLQRISATELRDLAAGESRRLLFCDEKGRVIDLPLARRDEVRWLLASNPGNAVALAEWIQRFVISEDVRLEVEPAGRWALQAHAEREQLLPAEQATAGEPQAQTLARLRRGSFLPAHAAERKLHPLECGLRAHISFRKGCYIGQEVIARMDSYDKIQRALYWLRGDGAAPADDAPLCRGSEVLGRVLEACADGPGYLALAQLPRDLPDDSGLAVQGAGPGRAERVPDPA